MICEDDIKFTEIGINSIQKLINKECLNKNNIFLNKPILIRLGKEYGDDHKISDDPYFLKNDKNPWANPCFIINVEFAKLFKKHLTHIYDTSDNYIHKFLPSNVPEIQAVTIMPLPIYELSYNKEIAIFPSEIHPKGINKIDKEKQLTHFKKVEINNYDLITKFYLKIFTKENSLKEKVIQKINKNNDIFYLNNKTKISKKFFDVIICDNNTTNSKKIYYSYKYNLIIKKNKKDNFKFKTTNNENNIIIDCDNLENKNFILKLNKLTNNLFLN